MEPILVVHGGAGRIPLDLAKKRLVGVANALEVGWKTLIRSNSALEAVVEAVRVMEDYPWLNAGVGSSLNYEGFVEMDALVMDGTTLNAGAVGAVRRVKNPVVLARLIMEHTGHIFLVGDGAEKFARNHGLELVDPRTLITSYQRDKWLKYKDKRNPFLKDCDTVGAVALDKNGNIAVAVSTGGLFLKLPGRIGDTPIIGAGGYADSNIGGASTTGFGEAAMRVLLSRLVVELIEKGFSPQEAAVKGIEIMHERTGGKCGVIALDKKGNFGVYKNTDIMIYGAKSYETSVVEILH